MSRTGPAAGDTRLSSIDDTNEEPFTLSSPRSVQACAEIGVRAEDLRHRSMDAFVTEAQAAGWVADVGRRQYSLRERKRLEDLHAAKTKYADICMAGWKGSVREVLADVAAAIDRLVLEKEGVYHPDVGKELKTAVSAEGRRYTRYPPDYAMGREADPGKHKVVSDLHRICREVVEHDKLLEPIEEWDSMVERGCEIKPWEDGPRPVRERNHAGLKFDDVLRALEHTFPNTTEDEREEAARHGLVLADCSSAASPRLSTRGMTASAHRKEPLLSLLSCSYCGGKCQQNAEECARCKNRTYCTRQCRQMDWNSGHCRECVELQPVEQRATLLARRWLKTNMDAPCGIDLQPQNPMPTKWHSIEAELTARSAEGDWRGVLRIQSEAVTSAKALESEWPERAIGIYHQLSDCHKALQQYEKALEFYSLSLALANATGSKEMEAQILLDKADLYEHMFKNICKACLYLERSLSVRQQTGDRWGEGRIRVKLGKLYLLENKVSEALEHNKEALVIAKEMGDQELEVHIQKELFICNAKLENFQKAFELRDSEVKRLRLQLVDRNRAMVAVKNTRDAQSETLRDRPRTASAFPLSSRDCRTNPAARPHTTQTQSRTRICMITKQEQSGRFPLAKFSSASSSSSSAPSVYRDSSVTQGQLSLPQSASSGARCHQRGQEHISRQGASSTDASMASFPREPVYRASVSSRSHPRWQSNTPSSTRSSQMQLALQQAQCIPRQDVFARSARKRGNTPKHAMIPTGSAEGSFMQDNGEITLSLFPEKPSDLLTTYTDKSGVNIPAWLIQSESKAEINTDLRFPRSPVAFIRPRTVAHAIHVNDDSLFKATENLALAWKARQPDKSKEEEAERRRQEEEKEQARRAEEAAKAAKIQQERARDDALKANGRRLFELISKAAEKHLEMFRWQVDSGFLEDRRELEAMARHLAGELMPSSGHERAMNKISAAAMLFGNLGTDKEAAALEAIQDHVDHYLDVQREKMQIDQD